MNKNIVRKEVAELINSIKEHSDEIGYQKRIPQLELELMLNKIKKLYEKSIIYNYLNSVENELNDRPDPILPVEHSKPEEKAIPPEPQNIPEKPVIAPPIPEFVNVSTPVKETKKTTHTETAAKEAAKTQPSASLIKSIRQGIGLNEKIMFIKQLFKGDSVTYENVISELESATSIPEAQSILDKHKDNYRWTADNPSYHVLQQLVKRRFSA